jgi:hypothetical protein
VRIVLKFGVRDFFCIFFSAWWGVIFIFFNSYL